MKTNKLVISINKSVHEVFSFTITPPNSKYWIPDIINEETNEQPVRIGTIYKMHNRIGNSFEITVSNFKQDKMVEWISTDHNYHCRYTYSSIDENTCNLEYFEWVDRGQLDVPFTHDVLKKLKEVIEEL